MGLLAQIRRPLRPALASIRSDGFRAGLSVAFNPDLIAALRERGAVWHAGRRMWVLPVDAALGGFLGELGAKRGSRLAYDHPASLAMLQEAIATPDADAFAPDLDVKIYPVAEEGGYVVDARFDSLVVACLRGLGGRLLRSKEGWYVQRPLEVILAALAESAGVLRGHLFIHEGEIRLDRSSGGMDAEERPTIAVDGAKVERGNAADDEGEEGRLAIVLQPLERLPVDRAGFEAAIADMSLLDHQPAGIWHLLSASSALLADEPGLGKSRQAAVAGNLIPGPGCALIICPANLSINWTREIVASDPNASAIILDKEGFSEEPDWLVASYERLGDVVELISNGRISPRAVFFDEAHSVIQPTAARTLNAFLVAQKVPRRYPLTATPILNRIVELHTLLRLSGHPLGDMERGDFAKEFGGSQEARRALAERVSEWMLRRPKSVLGLKEKIQVPCYLEMSPADDAGYRRIANDSTITVLTKIGRLRQYLERIKADWIIASTKALADGEKILIMCEFQDTVEYMAEEFAKADIQAVTYIGKYSKTRKQKAIDSFQQDANVVAFIGTTKAAGVGHTLTAAQWVTFATIPWTSALKKQAEDRAWRWGQKNIVNILIPIFLGTLDEQAMAIVQFKEGIEQDLLQDPVAAVMNLETDLDPVDAGEVSANDPEYAAMLAFAKAS